eukprot:TRINITY_DN97109_c0_g1_i1.p1 TRINITY_DN97109_c0_g1~~TRINITY_DN97109_c0_g1_i1.p1  ORF type:complete len:409 (-),score=125.99 TRINITY_DN97109_c0_g1_i1:251-1477(-)
MAKAAVEHLSFPDAKKEYIIRDLDPVLEAMVQDVLHQMPEDPTAFMIQWLARKNGTAASGLSLTAANSQLKQELKSLQGFIQDVGEIVSNKNQAQDDPDSEEEEEESDDDYEPPPPPPKSAMKARQSVSAEAYGKWNQKREFTPPNHPKSELQVAKLRSILERSFMFKSLDEKDLKVVIAAMEEMPFEAGARIIEEGDDGDYLFVIEKGNPEVKKEIDDEIKVVKKCTPGDVVGELALLYNCPRAATVDAVDKCLLWKLDRETFNHIVKEAATKKSSMYDDFLKKVSLFFNLGPYERSQIADALKSENVKKGDFIVLEGEDGDKFYIVEEGTLVALKSPDDGGDPFEVMKYSAGDYFGELALLKDQPRAASIKVTSETAKVLSLDRRSFKKMLGPLQDLLNKKSAAYT